MHIYETDTVLGPIKSSIFNRVIDEFLILNRRKLIDEALEIYNII